MKLYKYCPRNLYTIQNLINKAICIYLRWKSEKSNCRTQVW